MILNEPETSLHPSLLAPLARLISKAVTSSRRPSQSQLQVVVVTHAQALLSEMERHAGAQFSRVVLEKTLGETRIADQEWAPAWHWMTR